MVENVQEPGPLVPIESILWHCKLLNALGTQFKAMPSKPIATLKMHFLLHGLRIKVQDNSKTWLASTLKACFENSMEEQNTVCNRDVKKIT